MLLSAANLGRQVRLPAADLNCPRDDGVDVGFLHEPANKPETGYPSIPGNMPIPNTRPRVKSGMDIGTQIRKRREELGLSQEQLADATKVGQSTIVRLEANDFKKIPPSLVTVSQFLGFNIVELFPDLGTAPMAPKVSPGLGERDLPVYGAAEGGNGHVVISTDPVDYVRRPAPLASVRDGYAVIVVGESMVPAFEPGDLALVHPHLPPVPNVDVVLYTADEAGEVKATIKRLIRSTPTEWHLRQWNPPDGKKADFTLSRKVWTRCHRIVGKYSRR